MKPAPPNPGNLKTRPLRSLYSHSGAPGKMEGIPARATMRSLFKTPMTNRNKTVQKSYLGQIARSNRDSYKMSGDLKSVTDIQKWKPINNTFLRPSYDVSTARRKVMERAERLGETSIMKDVNPKIHSFLLFKNTTIPQTPKQSGLTKAYLKLSESRKKLTAVGKGIHTSPTSPFEETSKLHEKNKQLITVQKETVTTCEEKYENVQRNSLCDSVKEKTNQDIKDFRGSQDVKKNEVPAVCISSPSREVSAFPSTNVKKETVENSVTNNTKQCALSNVLKHCQHYCNKMSSINNVMDDLDITFQRVMVAANGCQIYVKFCDYQKRKTELYKEMTSAEEELEKAIKSELDVQSKFEEYLKKKKNIMKERSDLLENFKNVVKEALKTYGEKAKKPSSGKPLEEIVNVITVSTTKEKNVKEAKEAEPVLRRSKRLLGTPKPEHSEQKNTGRNLRSSAKKKIEENDDFVIKRSRKSSRRIQNLIYKDLQKSFNLCSPECSF